MRARIDIGEVEAKTKIRAKYLRAIENEEWDLLPGPVYVKSFLRTYGDFLGLDSRLLIDEYKRRYERPADHEAHPIAAIIRERERDARGPLIPGWALIGMVLVVVVLALYFVGTLTGGNSKTTPQGSTIPTAQRQPKGHKPGHHAVTHHATTTPTTSTPATSLATVKLVPTAPVYVCIADATGKKLFGGTDYDVGQTIPATSASKLLITLGNNSVHMIADGKPYTVPSASPIFLQVLPLPAGVTTITTGPTCS